jgi:hypothetical protein
MSAFRQLYLKKSRLKALITFVFSVRETRLKTSASTCLFHAIFSTRSKSMCRPLIKKFLWLSFLVTVLSFNTFAQNRTPSPKPSQTPLTTSKDEVSSQINLRPTLPNVEPSPSPSTQTIPITSEIIGAAS